MAYGSVLTRVQLLNLRNDSDSRSPTCLKVFYKLLSFAFVGSDKFRWWGEQAQALGFESAASGPLVRSSFHADELAGTVRPGENSKAR